MTPQQIEAACLALPGAGKEFPFGEETAVFKVAGKVFAICRLEHEPPRVSLRCEPELAVQLRVKHAAIAPGWHLNKRHWNTVTVDGSLSRGMIVEMIEDSYDLVVERLPRAKRQTLRWQV
ncbi:MmcQ/YjbR family DNA-binding protein [Conexibacter sp. CPCC 206217]|uniref:MmcQ/YjbR family DNA-binding protein n=1 Tax=Conexibacter sp. CPCC 206217 TaxID=3064574 RepID=UPI00272309AA|nr:MmcQ/YjbR family DNA-binding protein [Conexibacter sp. CPCC 206217]MDO8210616.1 MmcQ/YjbR family DNA-binding protein [Conexibacter sp. CPCC 206217]